MKITVGGEASFLVNVADGDMRAMTLPEIVDAYNRSVITTETYVWTDAMGDWMPIAKVEVIVAALVAPAPPPPTPVLPPPKPAPPPPKSGLPPPRPVLQPPPKPAPPPPRSAPKPPKRVPSPPSPAVGVPPPPAPVSPQPSHGQERAAEEDPADLPPYAPSWPATEGRPQRWLGLLLSFQRISAMLVVYGILFAILVVLTALAAVMGLLEVEPEIWASVLMLALAACLYLWRPKGRDAAEGWTFVGRIVDVLAFAGLQVAALYTGRLLLADVGANRVGEDVGRILRVLKEGGHTFWAELAAVSVGVRWVLGRAHARAARSCRIGYFRPFGAESSRRARFDVAPAFGAYGDVRLVSDAGFDIASVRPPHAVFGFGSDLLLGPAISFTDRTWKRGVKDLLDHLDFAVFDVSRHSPNIEWELRRTLEVLDPGRILFISQTGQADGKWHALAEEARLHAGGSGTLLHPLRYGRFPWSRWAFRIAFFRATAPWARKPEQA